MSGSSTPNRPTIQYQNPAISKDRYGWLACTCFAGAHAADCVFFGTKVPTGKRIHELTHDTSGGTTIPQVAEVLRQHYGIVLEQHVGSNVCRPTYAAKQARKGRGFMLQGNTHPLLNTQHRSTRGSVNHAIWVNEVRGGTIEVPKEGLIYDSAADRRYSWVDKGPSWWPWTRVLQFGAALRPWGDDDHRTLGGGKFYAAFVPPPRITLAYGGQRTTPFPDQQLVRSPIKGRSANVRSRPTSMAARYVIDQIPDGRSFVAYQKTKGIKPPGSSSDVWYGDWTGKRWIHSSNLSGIGGIS